MQLHQCNIQGINEILLKNMPREKREEDPVSKMGPLFWVNQKFYNNQPITTKLRKKSGKSIVILSPVRKLFSPLNFNTSVQCFQNWTNQWIRKIIDSWFTSQSLVGTGMGVTCGRHVFLYPSKWYHFDVRSIKTTLFDIVKIKLN